MKKKQLRKLIERALAKSDKFDSPKHHLNLLGSKQRYVEAIIKELRELWTETNI